MPPLGVHMPLGLGGFQYYLDELCQRALRIVGKSTQANDESLLRAREVVNGVIKSWESHKIFPWKSGIAILTPNFTEILGSDGLSYRCIRTHAATTNDEPVTGTYYRTYWEQGGSATANWAAGQGYRSCGEYYAMQDTAHVLYINLLYDNTRLPITIVGTERLNSQDIFSGVPRDAAVQVLPDLGATITVNPYPSSDIYQLEVGYVQRMAQKFSSLDVPEFLEQYADALCFAVAANLAYEFGEPPERISMYEQKAAVELAKLRPIKFEEDNDTVVRGSFAPRTRQRGLNS